MSTWNKRVTISFTNNELIQGEEVEVVYDLELELKMVYDAKYGADADGNRGMPMTFVDDYTVLKITDSLKRTYSIDDVPYWMYEKINDKVDNINLDKEILGSKEEDDCDYEDDDFELNRKDE